jgi:molybdopterin molybdotransferase
MTGAPLPGNADGVVPVEDVAVRVSVGSTVKILRASNPQRYVAARGSDCPFGRTVVAKGTLIGPPQIAVMASIGAAEVPCFARPRVAILGTGDELVPITQVPRDAQIRDSNTHMLAALLRRLGCDVVEIAAVRDDLQLIREAISRGMSHDALFVTGGMSMGEFDYVPAMLQELGVEFKIAKLRMKPGKPFVFGVGKGLVEKGTEGRSDEGTVGEGANSEVAAANPPFVFGLPGNPVSAYICTLRLASRLLTRLGGGVPDERWVSGRLDAGVLANGAREFYQPAIRHWGQGQHSMHAAFATVTPLQWKGSADLFTLSSANVLIVRAENEPAMPKGTVVRVLEI